MKFSKILISAVLLVAGVVTGQVPLVQQAVVGIVS